MISIYQYQSYKDYFNTWVGQLPKNGHGEYRRLALALNVSTTLISQIFNSEKDLSLEMACEMTEYMHFNDDESDYFLLLVNYNKSGSNKLTNQLLRQIKEKQVHYKNLSARLKKDKKLNEEAKQIYYSNWIYPAIRILIDIPHINTAEQISSRLNIPKNQAIKALDFLIKNNIVIQKNNKLYMGDAHLYLSAHETLTNQHLSNWRQVGFQKMSFQNEQNFFYTGQYALSEKVAEQIRKDLPDFIETVLKKVRPSDSETVRCLNIDFFEY